MAVTIVLNNTYLMGSPIVAEVEVGARSNVTFHRVVLSVTVTGSGAAAGDSGTFYFSSSVAGTGTVTIPFDISSAFRAVADRFTPSATTLSYPSYSLSVTAQEEYMVDGIVYQGDDATVTQSGAVYIGSYTDLERIKGQTPARWSRKPTTSPEICFYHPTAQGESDGTSKHLKPGACSDGGMWTAPAVTQVSVGSGSAVASNIYGIPYPQDGHEIRFINSLGVHENIFVAGLPTKEVNIKTDKYTIASQETLTQFSRGLAVKQNDYETWTFSSGPLDEAWASWYIHEFLMARWVWIDIGGTWIPCHVLPEETVQLVDRSKAQPYEVQFKLQLDINGSPL